MAEIRIGIADDTDWRSAVKKRLSSEIGNDREQSREAIREFAFNEQVVIEGVEYWFEPDRSASTAVLGLSYAEIGSFGTKQSVVNFYDYHRSVGSRDTRQLFLNALQEVSREETHDGYQIIHWKNFCTNSLDAVRCGMYDYLESYVWPQKCSEIVDIIDSYIRNRRISHLEMLVMDIIIGEDYFNDLFYLSAVAVAEAILTPELINSMIDSVPNKERVFRTHSRPKNVLITLLDEAQRYVINTDLCDGEFAYGLYNRQVRHLRCSSADLRTRILPLIMFISNWSLVLGAYLTVAQFGTLAFTLGE